MRVVGLAVLTILLPMTVYAALININTADEPLLETLPDIGPSKAQAIIDYRTQHGPFARIEDIQNVSGIGPATYDKIKALITVGDGAPPGDTGSSTPPTSSGSSSYTPPPSSITLSMNGPTEALLNVPLVLMAQVTSKGVVDTGAQIFWSFGDGSSQTGTLVEKVYRYPGTYLVTVHALDGAAKASDERVVTVRAASAHLTVSGEGIIIVNDTNTRLDLSNWRLVADVGSFRIPEGTTLLPKASVLFPNAITNLPPTSEAALLYPNTLIAARSMPFTEEVVQPSPETPSSYSVQAVDTTNQTPNSTTYDQAVVAPAASNNLAAAGAPLPTSTSVASVEGAPSPFFSPWIAGLLGILTLAGGAFIFI